jgi:hypothetical protein
MDNQLVRNKDLSMATMNAVPVKNIPTPIAAVGLLTTPPSLPEIAIAPVAAARKFRISIALPVEVSGTDLHGNEFSDVVSTEQVSCHGANIVINRQLGPDQQILLKRNGRQSVAYAVGQIGIRDINVRDSGYLYAVALSEVANQQMWNVVFPPEADANAFGSSLLYCESCKIEDDVTLDEIQCSVLEINHRIGRNCSNCATATFWNEVEKPVAGAAVRPAATGEERRKQHRVKMKTSACVCRPGEHADVTQVLDISRGGLGFKSTQEYMLDTWVRVAVPYIPGSANIFVAGRVAWKRAGANGMCEYGVEYSKK